MWYPPNLAKHPFQMWAVTMANEHTSPLREILLDRGSPSTEIKNCESRYAENGNMFMGTNQPARTSSAERWASALLSQARAEDSRRFPRHAYLDPGNSQHTPH